MARVSTVPVIVRQVFYCMRINIISNDVFLRNTESFKSDVEHWLDEGTKPHVNLFINIEQQYPPARTSSSSFLVSSTLSISVRKRKRS
jgi:hypothetical protein